jgi:hypothetical protein
MNESRLDEDLKALSKRPQPDVPTNFNAMVWSKIQSREMPAGDLETQSQEVWPRFGALAK